MKINILPIIRKCLDKEYKNLQKALNAATDARDSAPSAMESHHDTTRNQSEKLAIVLRYQYLNLKQLIDMIPETLPENNNYIGIWSYVELIGNNSKFKIILVPEGYGGREYADIKIVSVQAPLGEKLMEKKRGDNITFNGNNLLITALK